MSQWNNSYSYNNQYQEQAQGTWNGDPNGQYVNQTYYRPENNAQYVSFNEFLNQMQNSVTGATAQNYNNMQYNNLSGNNQYYQQLPSNSQTNEFSYSGPSNASTEVNPQSIAPQTQYNTEQNTYNKNEMILKSNLTPTATEFVPKSSIAKPSSNQNIPETSSNKNSYENRTDRIEPSGSSSDKNWRERPKSLNKNNVKEKPTVTANGYIENRSYGHPRNRDTLRVAGNDARNEFSNQREREENKSYEEGSEETKQSPDLPSSNSRNYDADQNHDSGRGYDNRRSYDSGRNSDKSRNYDSGRNYDNSRSSDNSRNYADNSRSSDTSRNSDTGRNSDNSRNNDSGRNFENSRNYDSSRNSDNSRNNADNSRSNDGGRSYDNSRNYDSGRNSENSRNYDGGRNPENNRNYDGSRGYDSARNDRKNQKGKSKAKDDNRTFYNSSKEGQDVRAREFSGRRNYTGSQRLRGNDRYTQEDEQFANNYLQRDDKVDKEKPVKSQVASPVRFANKNKDQGKDVNREMTQRERLTEQLDRGTLECLVCCDRVKQTDPVWSCGNCYHVLHLRCIRKWAVSSTVEGKWRCPACQNSNDTIPGEYRCMCGAVRAPEYQRGASGAHTCGRACRRPRACPHPCTLLCHPGPCPACQATVTKQCGCGAETRSVLCSSKLPQQCGRPCGKTLACGDHSCLKDCHEPPCDDCDKTTTQVCHCPAQSQRVVPCAGSGAAWGCGAECGRVLPCGAHVCRAVCHAPPCGACALLPATVLTCPCGKMKLDKEQRKSCTDPIPLCGNICAKPLPCGPDGDKHFCKLDCHEGPCPICPDKTLVQCRCGHSSREVPCAELPDLAGNVLCQKKCNKKLSCGRHRCRTTCCASTSHRCSVVCGRSLACGLHRCEEFCHTGHCARCVRLSFEELRCACGASAIFPPVPCGARAPPCSAPCRTPRPCSHPPHHTCHQGPCPPCVVLTARRCHGLHEERKTIPCSQEDFSCGLSCGKPLPCGKHTCIKICHKGPCDTSKCTQPCTAGRASCGHPCAAPCHVGAVPGSATAQCPSSAPCRRHVRATCPCGRRHADRTCADNSRDRDKIISALAATKIQEGDSVDLTDVQRPNNMLKTLECDDTCRQEARSRQLALALQIRNPDVSAKLAPRYSEAVRAAATRDPAFATHVHDKLTELVQRAKNSKQKTRAHSFPSMNRQKRQFIHELCEHFGCESVAYDAEPNRNVVATADREKSWLPAMSVLEVLAREAGKRRVPGPVLRAPAPAASQAQPAQDACAGNSRAGGWATLTASSTWAARSQPAAQPARAAPRSEPRAEPRAAPKIDYFDNPPDH